MIRTRKSVRVTRYVWAAFAVCLCLAARPAAATVVQVLDAKDGTPLANATVTRGNTTWQTGEDGVAIIPDEAGSIGLRALGHLRGEIEAPEGGNAEVQGKLMPFVPKALYLSRYGVGSKVLRNAALALVEKTEINALVIDIKSDLGEMAFRSTIPASWGIAPQKVFTVGDMAALIKDFKAHGIYTIARIVTFKDTPLATAKPELAVRKQGGALYRDREKLLWTDPCKKEVWDYNISIAEAAAKLGFDEIQFDYVRFPDSRGVVFSKPNTQENRLAAIAGFLTEARRRLTPYNVYLAADLFGYACWNTDDTDIGQRLEEVIPHIDYICPMLYPSGFQFGIPGCRNPVAAPYEIVNHSIENAKQRLKVTGIRFRPWLQAFRDYAFGRKQFGGPEQRLQIKAAEKAETNGWMLWNPRNAYIADGLNPKGPETAMKQSVPAAGHVQPD
jgi:hypothetical protein